MFGQRQQVELLIFFLRFCADIFCLHQGSQEYWEPAYNIVKREPENIKEEYDEPQFVKEEPQDVKKEESVPGNWSDLKAPPDLRPYNNIRNAPAWEKPDMKDRIKAELKRPPSDAEDDDPGYKSVFKKTKVESTDALESKAPVRMKKEPGADTENNSSQLELKETSPQSNTKQLPSMKANSGLQIKASCERNLRPILPPTRGSDAAVVNLEPKQPTTVPLPPIQMSQHELQIDVNPEICFNGIGPYLGDGIELRPLYPHRQRGERWMIKYSLKWQSFSNLPVHCSNGRKERDGVQCPFCPGHVAIRNRYLSRHVTKEHRMLVTSILSVNGPDKNQTDRPREPDIEELERL